jgi:hypothetical protein
MVVSVSVLNWLISIILGLIQPSTHPFRIDPIATGSRRHGMWATDHPHKPSLLLSLPISIINQPIRRTTNMEIFINSATWLYYAETIALEDMSESFNTVDEEVLNDTSLNIGEYPQSIYLLK